MANKKAARKFVLKSRKRAMANTIVRSKLKTLIKKFRASVKENADTRELAVRACVSALDKAAKRGIIHRNAVNRKKSAFAILAVSAS